VKEISPPLTEKPRTNNNSSRIITKSRSLSSVTITIEVGTNGATTLSQRHMNLSGYVHNVTIFSLMFTVTRCLVVGYDMTFYTFVSHFILFYICVQWSCSNLCDSATPNTYFSSSRLL